MARPSGHRLSRRAWEDIVVPRGLTPTSIHELSGIPRSTISLLIGGQKASPATATKLADALGVHPVTLFPTLDRFYVAAPDTELAEVS